MNNPTNGATLTVISRVDCHLCDEARRIVRLVAKDLALVVLERDVDECEELQKYTDLVPVVLIGDDPHQHWRIDERQLRAALLPPAKGRWWRRR